MWRFPQWTNLCHQFPELRLYTVAFVECVVGVQETHFYESNLEQVNKVTVLSPLYRCTERTVLPDPRREM